MNLLEDIGQSLRIAGGVSSPQVAQQNEARRSQFEQVKQQRAQMIVEMAARAAENGSIRPEAFQQIAQKYGYDAPQIGQSVASQKAQLGLEQERDLAKRRQQFYQSNAGIDPGNTQPSGQGDVTLQNTDITGKRTNLDIYMTRAEQAAQLGLEDESTRFAKLAELELKQKEKRSPVGTLLAERDAIAAENPNDPRIKIYDAVIAKDTQPAERNAQFVELPTGKTTNGKPEYQNYAVVGRNEDGTPRLVPQGPPGIKGSMVDVNINPTEALPQKAQEVLTQAFRMEQALRDIESVKGKSGLIQGWVSKGKAALGVDPEAIKFETAVSNLKVMAQAIIVGIPSNFDVQTFIATLPSLTVPESVNDQRIAYTRESMQAVIKDTMAYYKGTKKVIPDHLASAAKALGIDLSDIKPWDGKADPLSGARGVVLKDMASKYRSWKEAEEAFMRGEIKSQDDLADILMKLPK